MLEWRIGPVNNDDTDTKAMQSNLILTAIGADRTGIVSELTRLVSKFDLNILDSRMAIMGGEFTLIMLLSGDTRAISRAEIELPMLGGELELLTMLKRTTEHQVKDYPVRLTVTYEGRDKPGLLSEVTGFFAAKNIDIYSLKSSTESRANGPWMHSVIQLGIGGKQDIDSLRQDFAALCQRLEIDGCISTDSTNPI